MTDGEFWYVATPYSKYPGGLHEAFMLAVRVRGGLIRAGIPSFSPIVHSHPVAMECDMDPRDHGIWLPCEAPIMAAAVGLIVVMADGWQDSYGMGQEIEAFITTHRPFVYLDPDSPTLPQELIAWRSTTQSSTARS